MKLNISIIFILLLSTNYAFCGDSLNVETEYRLRGITYPNLDFNLGTSTDTWSYYSQKLRVSLIGNFLPDIEIGAKLQAIGIVGSSTTAPVRYLWQNDYPYPKTDFTPFIENAYLKIKNINDEPVTFTIGRQKIEYGDGWIISDNDAGLNAIHLSVDYPNIPWQKDKKFHTEMFTAKLSENFTPSSDSDVHGLVTALPWKDMKFEIGYFEHKDNTGASYQSPFSSISFATSDIFRQYYDFRIYRKLPSAEYTLEYIIQDGNIKIPSGNVRPRAKAYVFSGTLFDKKTKTTAKGTIAGATGDDVFSADIDESFTTPLARRYDGFQRTGWGKLYSGTLFDSIWDRHYDYFYNNHAFSGMGVLSVEMDYNPMYAWNLGIKYFGYSGTKHNFDNTTIPQASQLEKILHAIFLGYSYESPNDQKYCYNLGIEMNLYAKYRYSKYVEMQFTYARYTPPTFTSIWPKNDKSDFYLIETTCRF